MASTKGKPIGDRLRALGLRQVDFARLLSNYSETPVSAVTVNRWVRGTQSPSPGILLALDIFEKYPQVLDHFTGQDTKKKSFAQRLESAGFNAFNFAALLAEHPGQSLDEMVINVGRWMRGQEQPEPWVYLLLDYFENQYRLEKLLKRQFEQEEIDKDEQKLA